MVTGLAQEDTLKYFIWEKTWQGEATAYVYAA